MYLTEYILQDIFQNISYRTELTEQNTGFI